MLYEERGTRVARGISTRITNANNAVEVETPLNWKCLDHSRLRLKLDGQRLGRGGEVGGGVWFGLLVFIFSVFECASSLNAFWLMIKMQKTREGPKRVKMERILSSYGPNFLQNSKTMPTQCTTTIGLVAFVITFMPHHRRHDKTV